ncbi:hypothetical protein [Clostridium botulinum]|uniref:hypothetical protein n=1 Tax=Clostridium botulinum TaxID=1491 RepID=UPI0007736D12|nr:hypothetical protein [Clostridium botulinum]
MTRKEEMQVLEEDLESMKDTLLNLMRDNHRVEINSLTANAKIISFGRESLKREEVLMTIDDFNKGRLKEKVNINDLIKTSPVCFVLVKAKE